MHIKKKKKIQEKGQSTGENKKILIIEEFNKGKLNKREIYRSEQQKVTKEV